MKSKRILLLLSFLLLSTLAVSACNQIEYQSVTFEELTGNTTAYNGQAISITGIYGGWYGSVACLEYVCHCNCSEIVQSEEYLTFHHFYKIENSGIGISFNPPTEDGHIIDPDFEIGQEIILRGVVWAFELPQHCPCPCSCKLYKTLVIFAHEIQPK
jgi:hypothetical protein